jgi:hypothetical protein
MRKRVAGAFLSLGLGLGLAAVPLGPAAHAAPECAGVTLFPATSACVVRRDLVKVSTVDGAQVRVPQVCFVVTCTEERWITQPDVEVNDDEVVVLYYLGRCYYVGNAHVWWVDSASADGCP